MSRTLFRRHYTVTVGILLLCIVLGFLVTVVIDHSIHQAPFVSPAEYVKSLGEVPPKDRPAAVEQLQAKDSGPFPMKLFLVDEEGHVLYPRDAALPFHWNSAFLPNAAGHMATVMPDDGPAPGPPPTFFPPGPFHGGPGFQHVPPSMVARLPGKPLQYVVMSAAPEHGRRPPVGFILLPLATLIGSVLLGVGLSLLLLWQTLRANVAVVDSVMGELQRGNLKARLPIRKMDEVGQVMHRFNLMADEIERLVERVKSAEAARMGLLHELAHDLRTPIASLKTILETLGTQHEKLALNVREEFFALSQREVQYFERLVEDLLILAKASEPRYKGTSRLVPVRGLLETEIEGATAQYVLSGKKVTVRTAFSCSEVELPGDEHLLRRMFRNALENALSFARNHVDIAMTEDGQGNYVFTITDDGPGMTPEDLASYGNRRTTRNVSRQNNGRVSIGLGSVIIKSVALLHRGSVEVSNILDEQGSIQGASVRIRLPGAITGSEK